MDANMLRAGRDTSSREIPDICGSESEIDKALKAARSQEIFRPQSGIDFQRIKSACAIALHMHQPLIPAGGGDLSTAKLISNLQHMLENGGDADRYNASIFHDCYKRMGRFVPELVDAGKKPRIMLEYSGTLLHGLHFAGLDDVFAALELITCDPNYRSAVEWLGCPWGHAVAPSTPIQDYRLHVRAWQHYFASLFGTEALCRVRGFSPSEMAIPNHPDVAYEFVKTLKDCGYLWTLVQEHTVEQPPDGSGPQLKHIPHRLVCRNSRGEQAEILAFIKTQGSDTKLVAQMQPYYEACGLRPIALAGRSVPQIVSQIADGENGGVMMNEFPGKYMDVARECAGSDTVLLNATEYLEHLFHAGVRQEDLPAVQPIMQKKIWDRFTPGRDDPAKLNETIEKLKKDDHRFHMEGGSWTNNISWVRGYENVLGPMEKVSSLFSQKVLDAKIPSSDQRYQKALFYLMTSQTSCYRYWGQGSWTDYGREICRRAEDVLAGL